MTYSKQSNLLIKTGLQINVWSNMNNQYVYTLWHFVALFSFFLTDYPLMTKIFGFKMKNKGEEFVLSYDRMFFFAFT